MRGRPNDDATRALVAEPTKKAKVAIARAHGAHLAKDEDGARLLGRVALAWAEAAAAWVRAAEAEKKAAESEGRHKDLKDKIERAKALVAETEARKLQLLSEVAKAEEEAKTAPPPKPDGKKPKPKDPKAPKKAEEPKVDEPRAEEPKADEAKAENPETVAALEDAAEADVVREAEAERSVTSEKGDEPAKGEGA